jgi:hypothetical protein
VFNYTDEANVDLEYTYARREERKGKGDDEMADHVTSRAEQLSDTPLIAGEASLCHDQPMLDLLAGIGRLGRYCRKTRVSRRAQAL